MACIHVSGLPGDTSLRNQARFLKKIFTENGIGKFWIRELGDVPGTDIKEMTVELDSYNKARTAQNLLHHFVFKEGGINNILSVEIMDTKRHRSPIPYQNRSRERSHYNSSRGRPNEYGSKDRLYDEYRQPGRSHYNEYGSRHRSRSPLYDDASKLDLEINLLRKQRLVIEEERKLLLERKKLELIKEFGPSAIKDIGHVEDSVYRRSPRREERYQRRQPSPRPRQRPLPRNNLPQRSIGPKQIRTGEDIPLFYNPCKMLLAEMHGSIKSLANAKEIPILKKLIRSTLRKRLAIALESKSYMRKEDIVALYRSLYPATIDKDFINKILNNIRASYIPTNKDNVQNLEGTPAIENNESAVDGYDAVASTSNTEEVNPGDEQLKDIETSEDQAALSLDAADVELSLNNMEGYDDDWAEDATEWNDIEAVTEEPE